MECEEGDCESEAAFELHLPWTENKYVCAGHARVLSRQEGVVADALETADESLPGGAATANSSRQGLDNGAAGSSIEDDENTS